MCKKLCNRCYYAAKYGRKTTPELLTERNYIKDNIGVLTDGKGSKWTIDLDDFATFSKQLWLNNGAGYAKNSNKQYLHKLIEPRYKIVDHIDRNTFNCQKSNLRDGSKINALNSRKKLGISGYRGVQKHRNKWVAKLHRNNKPLTLGYFDSKDKARKTILEYIKHNEPEYLHLYTGQEII